MEQSKIIDTLETYQPPAESDAGEAEATQPNEIVQKKKMMFAW